MFGYGFLAVVLVLYLAAVGLDAAGDRAGPDPDPARRHARLAVADDPGGPARPPARAPRRAASSWSSPGSRSPATDLVPLLILAGIIGVISPTGNEVGPFLAVEQAGLAQVVPDRRRTATFAWYNLAGYLATATGALLAGPGQRALLAAGWPRRRRLSRGRRRATPLVGLLMAGRRLDAATGHRGDRRARPSDGIAPAARAGPLARGHRPAVGPVRARRVRRRVHPAEPDGLLVRDPLRCRARRRSGRSSSRPTCWPPCRRCRRRASPRAFGLINTMVFTHLPSNVLLLLVPLMPTLRAGGRRPARPLRAQPDGRADAPVVRDRGGRSGRTVGGGRRHRHRPDGRRRHLAVDRDRARWRQPGWPRVPFYLAGGLKIVYDLLLYRDFRGRPPAGGESDAVDRRDAPAVRPPPGPPAAA